ncbi:MAG: peptidyl-prolyl cis-trans isomerase [Gammaproteobacteria bacterium]|jgi:peptidyl-prolyl cis-trans isomerase D|nr:peptidyl-prolyl cis-trans isomerase [Gammaproteobacteria bacterium]
MLQDIRDKTQGWITRVVIGLVCASFILWGAHSFLSGATGGSSHDLATVNGQPLSGAELNSTYQRLIEQQQARLGPNFQMTPEMQASLKQMAVEQLVTSTALVQAAQKRDFRFTPKQVGKVISGISAFQENGHFSSQKFEKTLASLGYSQEEFFDSIRNAMLINQLRVGIVGSSFGLPIEVSSTLALVNQKRDIAYATIPAKNFVAQAVASDAEIQQYYQAHQDQFTTPQTLVLQYLELNLPDYAKQNHVTDSQKALQLFADASDKLTNLTYTNPQSLDAAAKALGLTVQKSEPISPKSEGKGIFANSAVKAAAFSKDVLSGNNSTPVNIDDQHVVVVRLLSQTPSHVMPLAQVKNQIINILKAKKLDDLTGAAAQKVVTAVMAGKSLVAAAADAHATAMTETNVARYATGVNAAINNAAFQLPRPGKQASVGMFRLPSGDYAVVQVLKIIASNDQQIKPVQERVVDQQVANAYAQLEYQFYVDEVLAKANIRVNSAAPSAQ